MPFAGTCLAEEKKAVRIPLDTCPWPTVNKFSSWFSHVNRESSERKRAERFATEDEVRGKGQALSIPGCPS